MSPMIAQILFDLHQSLRYSLKKGENGYFIFQNKLPLKNFTCKFGGPDFLPCGEVSIIMEDNVIPYAYSFIVFPTLSFLIVKK